MLLLTSTSDKLQVITGTAGTIDVHASWMDNVAGAVQPGRTNTPTITNAATTDVVGPPAATTQRNVKTLYIRNHGSTPNDITVQHTDGTTVSQLHKMTLPVDGTLRYIDEIGFQLIDTGTTTVTGLSINIVKFTADGSYVPSPGLNFAIVECIGGGGAGGGQAAGSTTADFASGAGGGGSGGYSRKRATAGEIGAVQAVTIGKGGDNVNPTYNAATGRPGGKTSFGTLCIANGGLGGLFTYQAGGAGGSVVGAVGDIVAAGASGGAGAGRTLQPGASSGGCGGSSVFGGGGQGGSPQSNGFDAQPFGSGGGGSAAYQQDDPNYRGGNGSDGVVVITEYIGATQTIVGGSAGGGGANNAVVPRSYLAGMGMLYATPTTFTVNPGQATSNVGVATILFPSSITKSLGAWAAGGANGALDNGAIQPTTWYHVFAIAKIDGTPDVLISLSAVAPLLPTNYSSFRRIGAFRTNASSQIIPFSQMGDQFLWLNAVIDVNAVTPADTAAHLVALTVPTGIKVMAQYGWVIAPAASADMRMYFSSPDQNDEAPIAPTLIANAGSSGLAGSHAGSMTIRTNTAAQIRYRSAVATGAFTISTTGWIDRRGRDD